MTDTHIKIKPVTPKVQYTGNGVTTVFPYEFAIFDESDMVVYFDDEVQDSGYTVSGAGETDGGNVTFSTAPDDGVKITLIRNVPIERLTDFQEGGTFRPKNLNDEFDRQTAFVQQVQETLDRAVKVGPTSDVDPEAVLSEVERVYASIDNVDAVADDIANVNAVAADLTNVDAVAGDLTNIDDVAANQTNIDAVAGNATNINAVASNETNINAVVSNETNINAVATNESNINAVAGNETDITTVATNIADVNTCATNIAAIQDAPNQAAAAAESAELSAQYANDKINQTHITNCVTNIPQDIKLELNNGTLTLKAGSKIYQPNGAGVFDVITTTSDITTSTTVNGTNFIRYENGVLFADWGVSTYSSGADPTGVTGWFYDTTANYIGYYNNGVRANQVAFPLGIVTVSSGAITSIDQVFNGFGYIGSTVFALPGVKGLAPAGRNADGTLKSNEIGISSVVIGQSDTYDAYCLLTDHGIGFYGSKVTEYREEANRIYDTVAGDYVASDRFVFGFVDQSSGVIKTLQTKSNFHALDWNDLTASMLKNNGIRVVRETYVNGTSWYRIWSDGWKEQAGFAERTQVNSSQGVTFLVPFSNNQYTSLAVVDTYDDDGHNYFATTAQDDTAGEKLTIYTKGYAGDNNARRCHWYACGY